MNRLTALLLFLTATLSASANAQSRPDYSGVLTAGPAPSAGGDVAPLPRGDTPFCTGDMGSGWGSPLTIRQDVNRLTIEYAFFARYDLQPPLTFTYALDGSETRNRVMMGRGMQEQRSVAVWAGNTLVITTRHAFVDSNDGKPVTAEVRQSLTIEPSGSLTVETTRIGILGGPTTTTRTVYTRR